MRSSILRLCLVVLSVTGCRHLDVQTEEARAYTLALVRTGPASAALGAAALRELEGRHAAFLQFLLEDQHVILARPVTATGSDATLRGVVVFDTPYLADAAAMVQGDPAAAAGALTYELRGPLTARDLRAALGPGWAGGVVTAERGEPCRQRESAAHPGPAPGFRSIPRRIRPASPPSLRGACVTVAGRASRPVPKGPGGAFGAALDTLACRDLTTPSHHPGRGSPRSVPSPQPRRSRS